MIALTISDMLPTLNQRLQRGASRQPAIIHCKFKKFVLTCKISRKNKISNPQ